MNGPDSLVADVAEKGRAGVQSLAAALQRQHIADCRAISDELAGDADLSVYERQQLRDQLLQLEAEFTYRVAVLDELSETYDTLAAEAAADARTRMAIAIDLAQASLRLQKLFEEVQGADADRLFV